MWQQPCAGILQPMEACFNRIGPIPIELLSNIQMTVELPYRMILHCRMNAELASQAPAQDKLA